MVLIVRIEHVIRVIFGQTIGNFVAGQMSGAYDTPAQGNSGSDPSLDEAINRRLHGGDGPLDPELAAAIAARQQDGPHEIALDPIDTSDWFKDLPISPVQFAGESAPVNYTLDLGLDKISVPDLNVPAIRLQVPRVRSSYEIMSASWHRSE